VVRKMDGPGAAGVNRTNWDLRSNPPAEPTPEQQEAIAAGFGFGPRGPLVEPGEYTIKIKASDKEASQKVMVEEDTRIVISASERAARREMIDQLYPLAKTADKDRKAIEGIQTALKTAREQWKKDGEKPNATKIPDDIVKAADELQKKVDASPRSSSAHERGWGTPGLRSNGSPTRCRIRCRDSSMIWTALPPHPAGTTKKNLRNSPRWSAMLPRKSKKSPKKTCPL